MVATLTRMGFLRSTTSTLVPFLKAVCKGTLLTLALKAEAGTARDAVSWRYAGHEKGRR